MASFSNYNNLNLPIPDYYFDDYLPSIFFAIPKKKYAAHLIDGSFNTEKITENILYIKDDVKKIDIK